MLDRETLATWARALCEFVNDEMAGPEWEQLLKLSNAQRRRAYLDRLRVKTREVVLGRSKGRPVTFSTHFAFAGLSGMLTSDGKKRRVVFQDVFVNNIDSLLAFVLAELQTGEAPIEIRECASDTCERVFSRKCGRGSDNAGFPQKFCSDECEEEQRDLNARKKRAKTTRSTK